MKKIKFVKFKKARRKRKIVFSLKCFLIIIGLSIYISIVIILLISFLKKMKKDKELVNEMNNLDKIIYKGEKINRDVLLNNYLSRIKRIDESFNHERERFNKVFFLPEYKGELISKNNFKKQFLGIFSLHKKKTINKIETFYIKDFYNFGNNVIALNNAIFYCEIIDCHRIILNDKGNNKLNKLIENSIYIEKYNITIKRGHHVDCNDETVFCPSLLTWDTFTPIVVKPQIRTDYIKGEILKNIPVPNVNPKDLYIHLRGGDIFKMKTLHYYAQPPLCFYEKIIKDNKFNNIYIIAMDKNNVVLDALMNKYKDIIFKQNNFEYDLSLLIYAYNIAASVSTFLISSIKFNDNLKDLWEYDINRLSEKYYFLHHHLYKFKINYKIHTMKPSDVYADKMFVWLNSESQLKLMLEDTCPYDFVLTKVNK